MTREEKIERFVSASVGLRYAAARQIGQESAEDVIQEALLVCIENVDDVRHPEAFIRGVVRHQILHVIRGRRRSRELDVQAAAEYQSQEPGLRFSILRDTRPDVLQELIRADLIQVGMNAVNARDREVLTRFYLRNQSKEDIHSAMNLTETQYRLLKSRAKDRFTDALRQPGPERRHEKKAA